MKKVGLGLFDSSQLFNFIKILFCNSRKYLLVYKNQTRKNRTIYPVCCCQVVVSWFQKKKNRTLQIYIDLQTRSNFHFVERGVSHFCVLYPPKITFHQSSIDFTTYQGGVLPYKGLMGTCGQNRISKLSFFVLIRVSIYQFLS